MNGAGNSLFVDTNLLLYTLDSANPAKQGAALAWRDALWKHHAGQLSWQVLNEFYANATGKLGAPASTARAIVEAYAQWQPVGWSLALVQRAWHWLDNAGLSYWDALILAAAERAGCRWILSEDFQQGRKYGPIRVINPFRTGPDRFFQA
jgi:predicted nucleic acid-binding protein